MMSLIRYFCSLCIHIVGLEQARRLILNRPSGMIEFDMREDKDIEACIFPLKIHRSFIDLVAV